MASLSWLNGLRDRLAQSSRRRVRNDFRRRRDPAALVSQKLEDRTLLAASIQFTNAGLLRVLADGDETIAVADDAAAPGQLAVIIDGVAATNLPANTTSASVTQIEIVAGAGTNTIDLSGVNALQFSGITGGADAISVEAGQGDDVVIAAADLGTSVLAGDGVDTINGGGGADVLNGQDGDDVITGGGGADTIEGGDGNDSLTAGTGDDSVDAGDGNDTVSGGDGDDVLNGDDGNDDVAGDAGNDTINGMAGTDTLDGGDGDDSIFGGSDADSVLGGAGADTLNGNAGNDTLDGGADNDRIFGRSGRDLVNGGGGDDFLNGANGRDTLNGDDGNDTILGGSHADIIRGGAGDDTGRGQGGPDTIFGNNGEDSLDGGSGDDAIAAADPFINIIASVSINPEGDPDTAGSLALTATLSSPTIVPVTVDFTTVDGTAVAGTDFTPVSGILTFPAGTTEQTVTIPIIGDLIFEAPPDETFQVVLSNPQNANIQNGTTTISITDDDLPAFSAGDLSVMEGSGASDVIFAIDISGSATSPFVGAGVGDVNGDGNSDSIIDVELAALIDYNNDVLAVDAPGSRVSIITFFSTNFGVSHIEMSPTAGYVAFSSNLTTSPIADVDNNGINDVEDILRNVQANSLGSFGSSILATAQQTFTTLMTPQNDGLLLVLSDFGIGNADAGELANLTNAGRRVRAFLVSSSTFGSTTAASYDPNFVTVTQPQDLSNELSMVQVGGGMGVQVTLDQPSTLTTTVDFASQDVTAVAGEDYIATSGTLTFPPGTLSQSVPITILNDDFIESDQTFNVVLSNPTNSTRIADGVGTVTIVDNGQGSIPQSNFVPPLDSGSTASGHILCETVIGGSGNDTLLGSETNDIIDGDAGNDLIFGNGADDIIFGGAGQDTINGGLGADTIEGQGGDDFVDGDADEDQLVWSGQADGDDTLVGGGGQNQVLVDGTAAADTYVVGQSATGELTVSEGTATVTVDETIRTAVVNGNSGDDTITIGDLRQVGRIALTIDGGVGNDTINASAALFADLRFALNGGDGQDTITGSPQGDIVSGGDGDDSVLAGGGEDTVDGDAGADFIDGGAGDDSLVGGTDDDTISGGLGDDSVDGGQDSDVLSGDDGADTLIGGLGDDNLNGNAGNDSLLGGSGQDTLTGGNGADRLDGGRNADRINGQGGADSIQGGHGDDTIDGGGGNDEILGGDGDDVISGDNGNDGIDGGNGDDLLLGRSGRDVIRGDDGDDTIRGGGGADTMLGDQGTDVLNGNGGNDLGQTGEGSDPAPSRTETIDEQFTLSIALLARLDGI